MRGSSGDHGTHMTNPAPAIPADNRPFAPVATARRPRIPQTAAATARPPLVPVAKSRVEAGARQAPADGRVVVSVSAKDEVWVSVSSEGKRLYAGLLEPSDSKVLTSNSQFRMRIGNAGGLEITWNGKSLGTLGSSGQVREIVFTADNYRVITPGDSL